MYWNDGQGRAIAVLAGILCGVGNGFQFMGGQAAGYAAADAVQVTQNSPRLRGSLSYCQEMHVPVNRMLRSVEVSNACIIPLLEYHKTCLFRYLPLWYIDAHMAIGQSGTYIDINNLSVREALDLSLVSTNGQKHFT